LRTQGGGIDSELRIIAGTRHIGIDLTVPAPILLPLLPELPEHDLIIIAPDLNCWPELIVHDIEAIACKN
jgi:hypothetical protein